MTIEHGKTVEILKWFEAVNQIPRCSKNEKQIGQWLMNWANDNGLEGKQDNIGNVTIKVPASPGYEDSPTVVIQGHQDMVCEKAKDSKHNFSTDPIKLVYDGEWLRADHTTLGADNGIAIAMGLTAALDKNLAHPPLELLFTVDEETALTGAFALEPGFVEGRLLLNLDSEDEGVLTIGCAGGMKSVHTLPLDYRPVPAGTIPVCLSARGMSGGHSADIHHEKANALKVLVRTLYEMQAGVDLRLADIKGGTVDNAVPRFAEAVLYIPGEKLETAETILGQMEKIFQLEFKNTDPGLKLSLAPLKGKDIPRAAEAIEPGGTGKVIDFLLAIPHGIWAVSTEGEFVHLVETSNNLASLKIKDKQLRVITSQRSPISSRLDAVTRQIEAVVRLAGGETKNSGRYPGWAADTASPLLEKCIAVYENLFGVKPKVETTHGGLECGVIGTRYQGMDMISIGPTIREPHSPEERIHIGSIGKVWDFFEALLRELK